MEKCILIYNVCSTDLVISKMYVGLSIITTAADEIRLDCLGLDADHKIGKNGRLFVPRQNSSLNGKTVIIC